jgi:hypothetical protein
MVGYRRETEHSSALARTDLIVGHGAGAGRPADGPALPLGEQPSRNPAGAGRAQARRLIAVANDLLILAAELEQAQTHLPDSSPPAFEAAPEDERRWLRHARQSYRHRRSRSLFFEDSLFGEPAWDLLLDLFIAAKERKRVPVTSACIGAAVPTTTALRWLAILEERGLVVREEDPTDARRIFVRLTAEAYARMVAYFARAAVSETEDPAENVRQRVAEQHRLRD